MSNVVNFDGITSADEPPASFLEKAKEWGMELCIVAGFDEKGRLYVGGSTGDGAQLILALELAKAQLIRNMADEE